MYPRARYVCSLVLTVCVVWMAPQLASAEVNSCAQYATNVVRNDRYYSLRNMAAQLSLQINRHSVSLSKIGLPQVGLLKATYSPSEVCSGLEKEDVSKRFFRLGFRDSVEFEQYMKDKTKTIPIRPDISSVQCLMDRERTNAVTPTGIKTLDNGIKKVRETFDEGAKLLSPSEFRTAISEYYSNLWRLRMTALSALEAIGNLDGILGAPVLEGVDCNIPTIPETQEWCAKIRSECAVERPEGSLDIAETKDHLIEALLESLKKEQSRERAIAIREKIDFIQEVDPSTLRVGLTKTFDKVKIAAACINSSEDNTTENCEDVDRIFAEMVPFDKRILIDEDENKVMVSQSYYDNVSCRQKARGFRRDDDFLVYEGQKSMLFVALTWGLGSGIKVGQMGHLLWKSLRTSKRLSDVAKKIIPIAKTVNPIKVAAGLGVWGGVYISAKDDLSYVDDSCGPFLDYVNFGNDNVSLENGPLCRASQDHKEFNRDIHRVSAWWTCQIDKAMAASTIALPFIVPTYRLYRAGFKGAYLPGSMVGQKLADLNRMVELRDTPVTMILGRESRRITRGPLGSFRAALTNNRDWARFSEMWGEYLEHMSTKSWGVVRMDEFKAWLVRRFGPHMTPNFRTPIERELLQRLRDANGTLADLFGALRTEFFFNSHRDYRWYEQIAKTLKENPILRGAMYAPIQAGKFVFRMATVAMAAGPLADVFRGLFENPSTPLVQRSQQLSPVLFGWLTSMINSRTEENIDLSPAALITDSLNRYEFDNLTPEQVHEVMQTFDDYYFQVFMRIRSSNRSFEREARHIIEDKIFETPLRIHKSINDFHNGWLLNKNAYDLLMQQIKNESRQPTLQEQDQLARYQVWMENAEKGIGMALAYWKLNALMYSEFNRTSDKGEHTALQDAMHRYLTFMNVDWYIEEFSEHMLAALLVWDPDAKHLDKLSKPVEERSQGKTDTLQELPGQLEEYFREGVKQAG